MERNVGDFEIVELLMYNTSESGGEQINVEEYMGRVEERQNDNYQITSESIDVVSSRVVPGTFT